MQFRNHEQLEQAKWAEKYLNVGNGKQYCGDNSPFPLQEYFRNKLLGKNIKMLEVNAGSTIVDSFVADTMTTMSVHIGQTGAEDDATEQEVMQWLDSIDYVIKLEEAMTNYFSAGYGLQQPLFRDGEVFVSNVDPSRWYPTLPLFDWQKVSEGKIITPFYEMENSQKQWYAFVETHIVGEITYELLKLENKYSLDGNSVALSSLPRFADLQDSVKTELDYFDIIQIDRKKSSETLMGQSILANVWDLLQEVTETQTQIRHERIKHLKAKMYGSARSFQKAQNVLPDPALVGSKGQPNSKQLMRAEGAFFDVNQDILFVPEGGTAPGYIQRDLESITKGMELIDKLLSQIAFTVGCPRSIFNLDQKGDVKVDTEKRKDRKYVRQVLLAQKRASTMAVQVIERWWQWMKPGTEIPPIRVEFSSPFDLTKDEITDLMRKQNPTAEFVSRKEAIKQIWSEKSPDERDEMEKEIESETPQVADSSLSKPIPVSL